MKLLLAALFLAATPADALTPESEQKILLGLDRMYALDLQAAATYFSEVRDAEPEEPAGPLFQAGLYWIQYAQTFDVVESGGSLEKNFLLHTGEAIKRGEARLKKNPKDAEALMWLGAAWGYRGRWKVLERSWLGAARLGLKGYRYLQKAVAADPGLTDAYLGLGIYEYYAGTMPAVIRVLKSFVVKGDKQQGLDHIQITLEKGKFSKIEAKLFLISILSGAEKNFSGALDLSRELRAEKPDNLYFGLMEVSALMRLKRWEEAAHEGDKLLLDVLHQPLFALQMDLFFLYAGESYQGLGDHRRAVEYFTWGIAASSNHRKAAVTYLLLRRGQSLDRLGRRAEALVYYREVAQRKDYFDSEPKAKAGLKKPVTQEELLTQLEE